MVDVDTCSVCRARTEGIPLAHGQAHLAQLCRCGLPLGVHAEAHPHGTDAPDPTSDMIPCPAFVACTVCAQNGRVLQTPAIEAVRQVQLCGACGCTYGGHVAAHPHPLKADLQARWAVLCPGYRVEMFTSAEQAR